MFFSFPFYSTSLSRVQAPEHMQRLIGFKKKNHDKEMSGNVEKEKVSFVYNELENRFYFIVMYDLLFHLHHQSNRY